MFEILWNRIWRLTTILLSIRLKCFSWNFWSDNSIELDFLCLSLPFPLFLSFALYFISIVYCFVPFTSLFYFSHLTFIIYKNFHRYPTTICVSFYLMLCHFLVLENCCQCFFSRQVFLFVSLREKTFLHSCHFCGTDPIKILTTILVDKLF
jgi:hypothetical protein